jgi:hypothetical protein
MGLPADYPNRNLMDEHELRNAVFLRGILDAFQTNVLKYYSAASSRDERDERLGEIRSLLKALKFVDGETIFTIEAKEVEENGKEDYVCPPGTHCERGTCVPDNFGSAFPSEPDED